MSWSRMICIAALAVVLAGCGGEGEETAEVNPENVEQAITAEVEKRTGRKPSTDTTPCEILDDTFVRAHFEVGSDVEISRSPSKYSPHPLCTVSWARPDAEELQKKNAEAMSEYMQAKLRGEDVKMPSFRTTNEVSLTLYEPEFEDARTAQSSFDAAMSSLSKGITASHEDVEMTFQADLVPVSGIGDKAMWAASMRQLSVVDGTRIFHVGVNTGDDRDADRAKAEEVAKAIAEKL